MSIKNIDDNTYPISSSEIETKSVTAKVNTGQSEIQVPLCYTQIGNLISFQLSQFSATINIPNIFKIEFPSDFPNLIDEIVVQSNFNHNSASRMHPALFTLVDKQGELVNLVEYPSKIFPPGLITVFAIKGFGYLN